MAPRQKVLTFRVRQLPKAIDEAGVHQILKQCFQDDEPAPDIHVHSLAQALPESDKALSKTATATITPLPLRLTEKKEWRFRTSFSEMEYDIIVDLHFLGFTVLNEVDDTKHVLDCIAISGLGSHAFGSWQQREDGSASMWLRDGIPKDLPGTRVIIYGYDTQVADSDSFQDISDLAGNLATDIIHSIYPSSKDMVILAHSLGGIVLKESMSTLANYPDPHKSILEKLRSILFFGVPHKGMQTSHLIAMVKGNPNEEMIRNLSPNSYYLNAIDSQFCGFHGTRNFDVVSLYETTTTKTVNKSSDGTWSRSGPGVVMVDRDSALHLCSKDKYAINKDHSAMVKLSQGDTEYKAVVSFLLKVRMGVEENAATQMDRGHATEGSAGVNEHFKAQTLSSAKREPGKRGQNFLDPKIQYSEEDIRSSLHLDVFRWRLKDITPHYASTFEWIFHEDALQFVPWLLEGRGVYWIHGKPGSGKSTLMKYIYDLDDTFEFLNMWKKTHRLIKAGFFFYYRGSQSQKSFEGLVRSILSQILDNVPELCQEIPEDCLSHSKEGGIQWGLDNLTVALRSVLGQHRMNLDICLFIDALDEFDGHLEMISNFIQSLVNPDPGSLTRCKVCFSSRPKDIISKHFERFPNFQIQDYTREDIRRYTIGRMEEYIQLNGICASSPELLKQQRQTVKEIVQKANGVFLWVRLALDDLFETLKRQGVSKAPDVSPILQELPLELDEFYQSIISRIPNRHRRTVYLTLEVLLRSSDEPTLEDIRTIISNADFQTLDECIGQDRVMESPLAFCHRLKDQCGGMIEIKGVAESEPVLTGKEGRISFLHETVREFVSRPGFKNLMIGNDDLYWSHIQNGYTELAKFYLTWLRNGGAIYDQATRNEPILQLCAAYCNLAELSTGESQNELIDGLQPGNFRLLRLSDQHRSRFSMVPDCRLSFAVTACLLVYMENELEKQQCSPTSERSLAHVVVEAAHGLNALVRDGGVFSIKFSPEYARMLKLLLDAGVSNEATVHGLTPFERLLFLDAPPHEYHEFLDEKGMLSGAPIIYSESILNMVKVFLEKGQDHNMDLLLNATGEVVGKKQRQKPLCMKPIHIASGKMLEILLDHKANVNSMDRKGRTALDYLLARLAFLAREGPPRSGGSATARELAESIAVLSKNGGSITRAGLDRLAASLCYLTRLRYDVSDIEKLPDRSKANGFISSTDLMRRGLSRSIPLRPTP